MYRFSVVVILVMMNSLWLSASAVKMIRYKPPQMDISYEKMEALSLLNEIRESMGMNTLIHNESLAAAAQAHADYLVWNHVTSHNEIPGHRGFTGRRPSDRAFRAGYLSSQVSENLSTKNPDARNSIDGLFSAIYHRFGFLDMSIDEAGVGVSQERKDTEWSAFVYLMGNSRLNALCHEPSFKGYGRYVYGVCRDKKHRISQKRFLSAKHANNEYNPKIVFYPYDGQTDVPPVFYSEIPDPLPDYDVSGFPISVAFNDFYFYKVELISFKLYDGRGREVVPVRIMNRSNDPHGRFTSHQFALFPMKRLEYDTDYRVEVVYRDKGSKKRRSWTFHTKRLDETLFRIAKRTGTITIKPHKSYLLYLVPLDGHDVIKGVQFPEDVDVTFYDNNTLRITLMSDSKRPFTIKSKRHTIHVKVK
ncbi:MAG: CAP domain-containing protein [Sulfurovum sp.]|nr:CAP domain-containing protein [Sulfurovum sp.]